MSKSTTHGSRILPLMVASGAVVMVLLIGVIAYLFYRQLGPAPLPGTTRQQLVAATQTLPPIDQNNNVQGQPTVTSEPRHHSEPESAPPQSTRESGNTLLPKEVVSGSSGNRPTWTPTPLPTDTPSPTPTPIPTFVSDDSYSGLLRPEVIGGREKWIDVNLTSQTLVAFEGSAPVFESLVSSGTKNHPTVTGQFRIWLRFSAQDMDGRRLGYDYNLKNVPFVQYFYKDYALHGTYWHNNFGTQMSHGCVNLPTPAAEWIFNWADYGTLVNIHN